MPIHERVIFQPDETEHNITLLIIGDTILEDDETFQLELSIPEDEPVSLLEPNHIAVINILNDDGITRLFLLYMFTQVMSIQNDHFDKNIGVQMIIAENM